MRIILEPAFVLHAKPYRDTSVIADLFTLNHGKITIVARSARGPRSRFKGCLIPFSLLLISCSGNSELLNLSQAEPQAGAYFLQGQNLFNGIYLNELLVNLLPRSDCFSNLFNFYHKTLVKLQLSDEPPQKILRVFEKQLLVELGYGLQLSHEAMGKSVISNQWYRYDPEQGLLACGSDNTGESIFYGEHLLAIEKSLFDNSVILKEARRLMRLIFGSLLKRPLKSRELYF